MLQYNDLPEVASLSLILYIASFLYCCLNITHLTAEISDIHLTEYTNKR